MTKFKHDGSSDEVDHSKYCIYSMNIPIISYGKTSVAKLGKQWVVPDGTDRNTVVCGEKTP